MIFRFMIESMYDLVLHFKHRFNSILLVTRLAFLLTIFVAYTSFHILR